ncbi:lytic transglycosylase domain-containing protein [Aridibaculum aurantiacum]|uniref:lytic transglycosylase domain-containing protein n=1 Tax=Aridibaculum aurantiacum TaxID=2810307 RepID=UPI001A97B533|nr:lytic transglycosylase domain-containing protein [Aridibaculum aurantiacum]
MTSSTRQVIIFVLGMIAGIFLISQLAFREDKRKPEDEKTEAAAAKAITPPKVPKQMTLFGEKVPLERQEIREAFDRELIYNYYNEGHILYILKLADRYFPQIEATLKAHGVPDDFKYLCVAESNLQNLVSRVGASGFWQFMKETAPGYNLEVNENTDERYHVEKSTEAACKYLKAAYAKFGNWTAAAASYNCGMGGYNGAATFQRTMNYYDLLLPEETNKYIFRILAFKQILGNANSLGFQLSKDDLYGQFPTKTVTVNGSISNLVQWAADRGTNYKMVKKLNPWIRGRTLVAKPGKTYEIKLPG